MKHGTKVLQNDIRRAARALIALGSIFALILFASACKNYHLDDADASRAGTGSVSVSLSDGAGSRMVMPSAPSASTLARYDITCSREGFDNKSAAGLTDTAALTVNDLAEGTWVLTVDAYDSSGTKVATGLTNVTIVAGKTAAASVVLSPIFPRTPGGKGTLSLVFACSGFQAFSNSWEIQLVPVAGGTPVTLMYEKIPDVTCNDDQNTITVSTTLDSGDWDMTFYLKTDGNTFVSVSDVVKVYDGLTSVSATGGPIPISASDFFKADRVRYVANTAVSGHKGNTRAQAYTLKEAIDEFNVRFDLTEADPGVIILTENVTFHTDGDPASFIDIQRPMKIMSLETAPSPYSISDDNPGLNTLIRVNRISASDTGSLTLERVIVQPGGLWGYEFGIVQVHSASSLGTLTLNNGAIIRGNERNLTAGGVYLMGGRLVMNNGSEISGNKAEFGGGVCSSDATDEIYLNGGIIRANTAAIAAGGVWLSQNATLHVASGSWSDSVKDNNGDFSLPDLARGYASVYDLPTFTAAISAPEPAYISMQHPMLSGPTAGFTVAKPVVIIQDGSTSFALYRSGTDNPLFTIKSGGTLMLVGYMQLDGRQSTLDCTASLISVEQNGTFIMSGPTVSQDASQTVYLTNTKVHGVNGSAVNVAGTFLLKNSEIRGTNYTDMDGTVYVAGTGTMRMESGNIHMASARNGGGVCVASGGKFYLYGGQVYSNTATNYGGGIYVNDGGELYLRNFSASLDGKLYGNSSPSPVGDLAVASAGKVFFSDVETPSPASWISINGSNATGYTGFTNIFSSGSYVFQ